MNVQTIPRADKTIKSGFVPKRDCFLFFDYQQIEYRLLAFYCAIPPVSDRAMAEVFIAGEDLHTASAKAVLELDRAPTDEERQVGKTYNFLTIYGGGPYKASVSLGIPLARARLLRDRFDETWPAIKQLHNPPFRNGGYSRGEGPGALQRRLASRGYITTLYGRHLHPHSPHVALNALIQGCAADVMRAAFVSVHNYLIDNELESRIVNVVHDELMLDCRESELSELTTAVPKLMVPEVVDKVVPIGCDTEISWTSWAEKQSLEESLSRLDGREDDLGSPAARDETEASRPISNSEKAVFV